MGKPASNCSLPILTMLAATLLVGVWPDCRDMGLAYAETPIQPPLGMVTHPAWSHNASIYEVNLRQYSPGGTFKEFAEHLPRLKEMGVGILWFMPVHPIGEKNRKGTLGSYYSVKDYLAVNPEYGTMDDFKALVGRIHEMGMFVIIDWIANHTAWDNSLTVEHPEWYTRGPSGNFFPPVPDWGDVIDLNYDNPELRRYMIDAMKFWVRETDIDGFRCDVAEMVPLDFWVAARAELDSIKPIFMLAEGESPALHERAFDATYGWDLFKLMRRVADGTSGAGDIWAYVERDARTYPENAYRMYFTSNHDENSWNGTAVQMFGDGAAAFAVLTATLKGTPLVYSGQEAGMSKRLAFFDKDSISWKEHGAASLYKVLFNLKKENKALMNGDLGGPVVRVRTTNDGAVFAFVREKDADRVLVVLNLSLRTQKVELRGKDFAGIYTDVFTGEGLSFADGTWLKLKPWEYRLLAVSSRRSAEPPSGTSPSGPAGASRVEASISKPSDEAAGAAADPDLVASWMTGSFSSEEQAKADTNYFDIRLEMVRIWKARTDGWWLYVEQAVAGSEARPYRQRVYHVTRQQDGSIRSDVFSVSDPLRLAGDWRKPAPLATLTLDSLEARKGCAVILRRASDTAFEGGTVDKECTSDLRGAAYAISEVRVTPDGLVTWDRGYDQNGKQVWGATQGGYVFKRIR
jgi:glycosidase